MGPVKNRRDETVIHMGASFVLFSLPPLSLEGALPKQFCLLPAAVHMDHRF
jgi:hypothetical protein